MIDKLGFALLFIFVSLITTINLEEDFVNYDATHTYKNSFYFIIMYKIRIGITSKYTQCNSDLL